MNQVPAVQSRRERQARAWQNLGGRKFSAATVFVPLMIILIHFVVLNLFSVLVMGFMMVQQQVIHTKPEQTAEFMIKNNVHLYGLIGMAVVVIPICLLILRKRRKTDERCFASRFFSVGEGLASLWIAIGTLGAVQLAMTILASFSTQSETIREMFEQYKSVAQLLTPTTSNLILQIVAIAVIAPIVEELVFRGIVMGEFMRSLPVWAAIVLQALLFGIIHFQLLQSTYAFISGIIFGLVAYWTRSIWATILMHMIFNFAGAILPYLVNKDAEMFILVGQMCFIVVAGVSLLYLRSRHKLLCKKDQMIIETADKASHMTEMVSEAG